MYSGVRLIGHTFHFVLLISKNEGTRRTFQTKFFFEQPRGLSPLRPCPFLESPLRWTTRYIFQNDIYFLAPRVLFVFYYKVQKLTFNYIK